MNNFNGDDGYDKEKQRGGEHMLLSFKKKLGGEIKNKNHG